MDEFVLLRTLAGRNDMFGAREILILGGVLIVLGIAALPWV